MRFAIDACVPAQLADALAALGADVISAAGRPAMPDEEVLSGALARDRVLITSDKDFGDLVFRDGRADALADETARRIMSLPQHGRGLFAVLERGGERTRAMAS